MERSGPKLPPTSGLQLLAEVRNLSSWNLCFSALLPGFILPTQQYLYPPTLRALKILPPNPSNTLTLFSGSFKASRPGVYSGQTSAK